MVPDARPGSYYGRPILKEPVWRWPIPAYMYSGGLAAGAAVLGFRGQVRGERRLRRRGRLTAFAALGASTYFLIEDLGRPSRFYNMLRVAKPTSAMSVGSWILALFGPAAGLAAASEVTGLLPALGDVAAASSAVAAPFLATYTAVLVADTAVPAWHEARHHLPFVFAGSAAAAGGGLLSALVPGPEGDAAARLAVLGAGLELGAERAMERSMSELDAEPYRDGRAGQLGRLSRTATAAGSLLLLAGRRRPVTRVAGGLLVTAGSALLRFAVFEAGRQSARDPKYVVAPQKQRLAARGRAQ